VDPWSTAAQFNAVLNAPLAFGLALLAVLFPALWVMWKALEWAYRMRLDKADFYIKMAGQEHELSERIDERLAKLNQEPTSAEAPEAPSEREALIQRRRAANTAVTQNLNAASTATSG
jgi:hypothetical protein